MVVFLWFKYVLFWQISCHKKNSTRTTSINMLKLLNTSWNSPFLTWPALYTTSPHLAAILNVPLAPVSLPARIIWGFPSLPQVSLLVPGLPKHHGLGLGVEWSWRGGGSRVEDILKEVTPLALGEFHIIWKDNIERVCLPFVHCLCFIEFWPAHNAGVF